ncbi:MAG: zinc-finger domain-containing protein [Burkholderiales bacterium]|jgi:uncharacterized Zn-finger protein|nr:zinc-finger domain-containing protein [Betaproteobacteria bacterium]
MSKSANTTQPPPQGQSVILKADELPAFCPNPRMPLWNHHPRVFLDVSHEGHARCPYCGTRYQLEAGAVVHGH